MACVMIIVDETVQEDGCDKTGKEGKEKSTDGRLEGKDGTGLRKKKAYSTAVIDGIKRNSTIYVFLTSTVRKTDTTLNKGEDIVVCLTGARIKHVTERVQRTMGREMEGPYWFTSGGTTRTRKEQQQ